MLQDQLLFRLIQSARKVHESLGPGFVESIYSRSMIAELKSTGFTVEREKLIRVVYCDTVVGRHWLDLVVEGAVILELKANRGILPVHIAQVRSYLHATTYPAGVILNFGMPDLQWEKVEPLDRGRPRDFRNSYGYFVREIGDSAAKQKAPVILSDRRGFDLIPATT